MSATARIRMEELDTKRTQAHSWISAQQVRLLSIEARLRYNGGGTVLDYKTVEAYNAEMKRVERAMDQMRGTIVDMDRETEQLEAQAARLEGNGQERKMEEQIAALRTL
ncbi:hypothetical protein B0A55_12902 [Friedmanniomyces simplex]|uniref:Uncharacterized protein n=1 Tax=Friedmanniomyces simplex TaxID=329884 RepID=A0A4U0WJU4_9PEZI|nr:hypothetical protein B0A55_12902 [Friedmanniomyces simplex]